MELREKVKKAAEKVNTFCCDNIGTIIAVGALLMLYGIKLSYDKYLYCEYKLSANTSGKLLDCVGELTYKLASEPLNVVICGTKVTQF